MRQTRAWLLGLALLAVFAGSPRSARAQASGCNVNFAIEPVAETNPPEIGNVVRWRLTVGAGPISPPCSSEVCQATFTAIEFELDCFDDGDVR